MFDAYVRRARLLPVALACAPALLLLGGSLVPLESAGSAVALVVGGLGCFVCGLTRDRGRAIETELWASWNGPPTLRRLRWREGGPNVAVLHANIEQITGRPMPSEAEEVSGPAGADAHYNAAISALRDLTRGDEFALVHEENAEYGFRRNCLGLRPVALLVALLSSLVSATLFAGGGELRWLAGLVVGLVAAIAWARVVTPDWVRRVAEIYADRLLEATERLRREVPPAGP